MLTKKLLLIIGGIFLSFILILTWYLTSIGNYGILKVNVEPKDAVIRVEGKKFEGTEEIKLKPGRHSITISKEGYTEIKRNIIIKKDSTTQEKVFLLSNEESKLLASLPKETLKYKIEYQLINEKPEYTISLYAILNYDFQKESYQRDLKLFKEESLKYIKSFNVNPAKLDIKWLPEEAKGL